HTRSKRDWSSDVCSSDLMGEGNNEAIENDIMTKGAVASQPVFDIDEIASFTKVTETDQRDIEPWEDRNNILKFGDPVQHEDGEYKTLLKNATQKLRPIDELNTQAEQVKAVQLTSSPVN